MLYTIVPYDDIFSETDSIANRQEITIGGVIMQFEPGEGNLGKISRLISTNPQDYLNPRYQPGTIVFFTE